MSKQTAVNWLEKEIDFILLNYDIHSLGTYLSNAFEEAKEIGKEQMIDFYVKGCNDGYGVDNPNDPEWDRKNGERLYNETYGGDE